eukprot:CAMPEP_0172918714 /NCGR_PEP_ID=MMETSP1075-20121228/200735_1 /TAXON_ID=2916 /ORGANISM="Ceratium fusus, Strain PA161109" /LENGTH=66 /DNA_ID=CAMNT_0013778425 /DNA_START=57 /DNA_END=255 /DNA_ORIENTATION=-
MMLTLGQPAAAMKALFRPNQGDWPLPFVCGFLCLFANASSTLPSAGLFAPMWKPITSLSSWCAAST